MTEELRNKLTERFNSAYGEEVKIGLREALRKVYIDGCEYGYQYALQHPQWIPVEEELPKPNIFKEGKTFPLVLVCLNDGCEDTDAYDTDNKTWCKYDGEVEYWMPMPVPPQRKEE